MLEGLVAATQLQMTAKLAEARAKFQHSTLKGGAVENAVRDFLRSFVPRRLAIGTGEVIDHNGNRSAQTDVVIANEDHPFTFSGDDPGLFFIEGVSAAGEVKAVLTTQHLASTIEASRRFKELVGEPGMNSSFSGNLVDLERFSRTPPYFLLALESQLDLDTVYNGLVSKGHYGDPVTPRQIDAIFVLGQGGLIDCGLGNGSFGVAIEGAKQRGWARTAKDTVLFDMLAWLTLSMVRELRYEPVLAKYTAKRLCDLVR